MKLGKSVLGYTSSMPPMTAARVYSYLSRIQRYDGVVKSSKENIVDCLIKGHIPEQKEYAPYYNSRTGAMTKPVIKYYLMLSGSGYELSKTEYDFCLYLIEMGMVTQETVAAFLEKENAVNAEKEKKRAEEEAKRRNAEEQKLAERTAFKLWLEKEAQSYDDEEKISIQRAIYMDKYGNYDPHAKRLLVLIDHIDEPNCKAEIKQYLHLHNPASRKIFRHITGITLPRTYKGTVALLDHLSAADYKSPIPYRPAKPAEGSGQTEEQLESFYELNCDGKFREVQAKPIKKYGLDLFLVEKGGYIISEARSGVFLAQGDTKTKAFKGLAKHFKSFGTEGIQKKLEEFITIYGLSPRYQGDNADSQSGSKMIKAG